MHSEPPVLARSETSNGSADKVCPNCGEIIPPPIRPVTPRQRDVIARLAAGEDLNQTAASLNVSRKTVEKHVQLAKARLGVKTLSQLCVTAVKSGLITI